MSRRRRVELAPMLFPFLDVLVCTMGTLILLLPLVTKKVSEHVQTAAEAEVHKELAVAEEDADWRAEQLLKIREKQTQELERRRGQLAHVEEHLQRLDKQLRKLTDEMIAAASNVDVEKLRTEVEQLRAKEAQLRMEIQQKEAEQVSGPPRFVILPYRGNNGTQRRPVYIECTADKIVIQPENIVIDAQVLKGPLGPGNPLDAALRAIRLHWQTIEPEPPYPLLVVRPDGVLAYAVARTAMTAWDDQFGYELVPDGVDLVFGDPDAVLRQKIQVAINDAVERRDEMIAAMPGRYRSTGTSQMDRSMAAASAAARVGNDPLDPLQRWQAAGEQSARQQPGGNGGTNKTASGGTSSAGSSVGGYGGSSGELMPLEGDFTPAPAGSEDSFAMNGRGGAPGGGVPGNGQLGGYGSAPSLMSQNQWQSGQGPVGNSMLGTGPGSTGGTPSMLGAGAANNTGMGSGLTGTQAGPGSQPQSSATGFNAAAAGSELNPATGNGTSGEASQGTVRNRVIPIKSPATVVRLAMGRALKDKAKAKETAPVQRAVKLRLVKIRPVKVAA